MVLIPCKHLCFILCFYILCVSPNSEKRKAITNVSNSDHHTSSPHPVHATTIHSRSSHTTHHHKSTPHPDHPTTIHSRCHTTHHSKINHTIKPKYQKSTPKHDYFATPSANMSSNELYLDPDIELSSESKSMSYEILYANESDIVANETFWLSLDDAFEILSQKKYDHISAVHALMNSYKFFSRKKRFRSLPYGRQHSFITIEGLDKEMRETLAEHLVELIEGKLVLNPTPDFQVIWKALGNNTELQRAYLTVTTNVAAQNARKTIETDPAVTPGYYLSEAAFVAAQLYYPHLPPKNSSFWSWPPDLFKPDMIFFLLADTDLNPNEDLNPQALILKNSVMQIFTLWENPPCVAIQNKQNYSSMLEEMIPHLNKLFS